MPYRYPLLVGLCLLILLIRAHAEPLLSDEAVTITEVDLQAALALLPETQRQATLAESDELLTFIGELYRNRRIEQEAARRALADEPAVARQLQEARLRVLYNALLRHNRDEQPLPDFTALARERYLANQADYREPERRKIAQLFIAADLEDREASRRRAETLLTELREGAEFAAVAQAHSEGAFAEDGGVIDEWLTLRPGNPVLVGVFELPEIGASSDVLETEAGYHIVQLIDIDPARVRPFEEVENAITERLRSAYRDQLDQQFFHSLYPSPEALINHERIEALTSGD